MIVQGIGLLSAAAAAFLPGLTVDGLLLRLAPSYAAEIRRFLLGSPAPWLWDAGLLLLFLPMWMLPAAAGTAVLVAARLYPPRRPSPGLDGSSRHEAHLSPKPPKGASTPRRSLP